MELLVVIAIMSLLAAILFPVFGRARESARRTACSSNLKQLGMAMSMYTHDYDERLVPVEYTEGTSTYRWPQLLNPYIKNRGFVRCPGADYNVAVAQDLSTNAKISYLDAINSPELTYSTSMGTSTYDYLYGLYPSYGYNYVYLSPTAACPDGYETASASCALTTAPSGTSPGAGGPGVHGTGDPGGIPSSGLDAPAQTVALTDCTSAPTSTHFLGAQPSNLLWGYYIARAPQRWALTPPTPPVAGTYGRVVPRHLETTNVLFADGHVKAMNMDAVRDPKMWRAKKS